MRATDIIMKKRGSVLNPKGQELTREEIEFLIKGYVAQEIPEYQVSSWLMAVYFNGMTFAETANLTDGMLHSGDVIDFSKINMTGPFVDKHSTGGVGDKISLPLAPIVAACGVKVPMMSGRALGHTGGTIDKLESFKGFSTSLTNEQFIENVNTIHMAIVGQTADLAPADKKLYEAKTHGRNQVRF